MLRVEEIFDLIGFDWAKAMPVDGLHSIAHLFRVTQRQCGIYVFELADGTFYIGKAKNVVRRFNQHKKNHETIVRLWFRRVPFRKLDEIESACIYTAEKHGLSLINKTYVSNYRGDSDFDDILTLEEQEAWVQKGGDYGEECVRLSDRIDEKYVLKYRHRFHDLKGKVVYGQIRDILEFYLRNCLPAFRCTEQAYWSLSCMPSTNAGSWPRYICLNVNAMEVLVLGSNAATGAPFGFINLARMDDKIVEGLDSTFPDLVFGNGGYRTGGYDQMRIRADDFQIMIDVLNNPIVLSSIRRMNLRLMRRGGTVYYPYHCFDLVNDAVG